MSGKRPTTDDKLNEAAERALSGENLVNESQENAAKPISLHPLKLETALAALLKVKPEPKKAD